MSITKYCCPICNATNLPFGSGKCVAHEDENGNLYVDLVEMPFKVIDNEMYAEHTEKEEWKIARSDRESDLLDCLTGLFYGLKGYSEKSLKLLKDYKCNVAIK